MSLKNDDNNKVSLSDFKKPNKPKKSSFIPWIAPIFIILLSIGAFNGGDYISIPFLLVAAIITLPIKLIISLKERLKIKPIVTIIAAVLFVGIGASLAPKDEDVVDVPKETPSITENTTINKELETNGNDVISNNSVETENSSRIDNTTNEPAVNDPKEETNTSNEVNSNNETDTYVLNVGACDASGYREPNAKVDVGYGYRVYWAYTNEYGQLVKITADEIILQDDYNEPVNDEGRYCDNNANVQGVEHTDLDEGHVVADSLGGVGNAYNITPQDSTLNRYGDQAYMESIIRDAGGATNYEAIITYPDTTTMVPSHYKYTFTINGEEIVFEFDNVNPEGTIPSSNSASNNNSSTSKPKPPVEQKPIVQEPPVVQESGQKVWISQTGSKYHTINNCGRMNPDKATQISVEDAIARGLEACDKCFKG